MKTAPATLRAPSRKRRWLRPRVFAIALLASLPVGLIVAWLTTGYFAATALRKAEAEADRLDPGWRFGDLVAKRAIVPDRENSALQVRVTMAYLGRDFPIVKKGATTGTASYRFSYDGFKFDELAAWDRIDDALAATIRRQLRIAEPAVVEARKISAMDRGREDPKVGKALQITVFRYVSDVRTVNRLLAADAVLRSHDGDPDGALESCRACVNVARSLGDEPFIISQLVRIAGVGRGLQAAERALNQGEPSDAAMSRLQALLLDEADAPLLLLGLRSERAEVDDTFTKLASGELAYRTLMPFRSNDWISPTAILASASGAFVRYNHGLALARLNEAVEIGKRPFHEQLALWDDWEARAKPSEGLAAQLASSLSRETVPWLGGYSKAAFHIRARLFAMATLLAAERHRLAHGAFPESIDAIDAKLLPRGLIDPFSGGPLHYKSDGEGGVIIYSVSNDRTDDGGEKLSMRITKGYDVGFRLHAPKGRGRPPKLATLPEDVFRHDPKREDDEIARP